MFTLDLKQCPPPSAVVGLLSRAAVGIAVTAMLVTGSAFAQSYELAPWEGVVPAAALAAGETAAGEPLYVCVVDSWGGQHPGSLAADGVCRVAWAGRGHIFNDEFTVLVVSSSAPAKWREAGAGEVAENAFRAGDDGSPIYVCRTETAAGLLPGKLRDDGWCYVAADGEELTFTEGYEVLVD